MNLTCSGAQMTPGTAAHFGINWMKLKKLILATPTLHPALRRNFDNDPENTEFIFKNKRKWSWYMIGLHWGIKKWLTSQLSWENVSKNTSSAFSAMTLPQSNFVLLFNVVFQSVPSWTHEKLLCRFLELRDVQSFNHGVEASVRF